MSFDSLLCEYRRARVLMQCGLVGLSYEGVMCHAFTGPWLHAEEGLCMVVQYHRRVRGMTAHVTPLTYPACAEVTTGGRGGSINAHHQVQADTTPL